jgi:arylsulfatase A
MKLSLCLVLVSLLSSQCCAVRGARPNIVLVLADDLGIGSVKTRQSVALGHWSDMDGVASPVTTPQLEALSASGLVFERMYTNAPICSASRYALLTGIGTGTKFSRVRGNTGEAEGDHSLLSNGERTFAQLLRSSGYATAAFGKFGFLEPPSQVGFDYYLGTRSHVDSYHYFPYALSEERGDGVVRKTRAYTPNNTYFNLPMAEGLSLARESRYCNNFYQTRRMNMCNYAPEVVHNASLAWLAGVRQPFFLYYASQIPHDSGFNGKVKVTRVGPVPSYDGRSRPSTNSRCATCRNYGDAMASQGYSATMANIGSAVTNHFDRYVGELVSALSRKGVLDDTLVIVTSDNGPSNKLASTIAGQQRILDAPLNANGPFTGFKRQLYEGSLRLPNLFLWGSRFSGAPTSKLAVQVSDLAPTLLDLAGVAIPRQFTGISFANVLRGQPQTQKHSYLYSEICQMDKGVLGQHNSCDFVVAFGDNLQYRAEWTTRVPGEQMLWTSIRDGGPQSAYVTYKGNTTKERLAFRQNVRFSPMVRNLDVDITETRNFYTTALRDQAEAIAISVRVVPQPGETIPV